MVNMAETKHLTWRDPALPRNVSLQTPPPPSLWGCPPSERTGGAGCGARRTWPCWGEGLGGTRETGASGHGTPRVSSDLRRCRKDADASLASFPGLWRLIPERAGMLSKLDKALHNCKVIVFLLREIRLEQGRREDFDCRPKVSLFPFPYRLWHGIGSGAPTVLSRKRT